MRFRDIRIRGKQLLSKTHAVRQQTRSKSLYCVLKKFFLHTKKKSFALQINSIHNGIKGQIMCININFSF